MTETIRYASGLSSLGEFLLATSERGLVALEFGDGGSSLISGLSRRFPAAKLSEDRRGLEALVQRAARLIERPAVAAGCAVDMRGSEFECEVWSALQEIPAGRTLSYLELACRLGGGPQLARQVGEACAANPLAVVIPCHRVLKKDGSLSGYRWGTWRKRLLLEREYLDNFTLLPLQEQLA
ncbi:MAG: methylated-DNA--[protein]-cysteine S-methyltransferase [Gammaproteobacteria bacterium]|nr:methylated-DNA--[protein]-cysteine S-methyltransferase [Gammaproteobacteria bacterium]